MAAADNTMIRLQSNDGHIIEVNKADAERSLLIKNMLEDLGDAAVSETIPIPNVSNYPPPNSISFPHLGCF